VDMFRVAPRLRNVHIKGPNLHNIILPIEQLTKLWIEDGFADECVDILQRSQGAIDCTFNGIRELMMDWVVLLSKRSNRSNSASNKIMKPPLVSLMHLLFLCFTISHAAQIDNSSRTSVLSL
jgi:hypothetical protein